MMTNCYTCPLDVHVFFSIWRLLMPRGFTCKTWRPFMTGMTAVSLFCTHFFRVNTTEFAGYANGKSIGVLSEPLLRAWGPHFFKAGVSYGRFAELPPYLATVAHYESSCSLRWEAKFRVYSHTNALECSDGDSIPLDYWCASALAFTNKSNTARIWRKWRLLPDGSRGGIREISILNGTCSPPKRENGLDRWCSSDAS